MTACRLLNPEYYKARDACAESIAVLRAFPTAPYRTIGGRGASISQEQVLRNAACAAGADAVVIIVGEEEGRKPRKHPQPVLEGTYIRYVNASDRAGKLEEASAPTSGPALMHGCGTDGDCKGDRICVDGKCVAPSSDPAKY